eukprot:1792039-Prymnesium_polylepis.1
MSSLEGSIGVGGAAVGGARARVAYRGVCGVCVASATCACPAERVPGAGGGRVGRRRRRRWTRPSQTRRPIVFS